MVNLKRYFKKKNISINVVTSLLMISLLTSLVFAKSTGINTGPVVTLGANVISNINTNIQILSDYTGSNSSAITSKLTQFKSDMFSKGVTVNFNVSDGTAKSNIATLKLSKNRMSKNGSTGDYAIINSDGTLSIKGPNTKGQLGLGDTATRSTLTKVPGLSNIIKVIVDNGLYTIALDGSGNLWFAGYDEYGTLPGYQGSNILTFTKISSITGIVDFTISDAAIYAVKGDGTVWVWGFVKYDTHANMLTISSPMQVSGLASIISVSGADYAATALKSDGTVYRMTLYGNSAPFGVQLNLLSNFSNITQIQSDYTRTIGLKSDGTIWQNSMTGSASLISNPNNNNYVQIAGGNYNSNNNGLKNDGTVWVNGAMINGLSNVILIAPETYGPVFLAANSSGNIYEISNGTATQLEGNLGISSLNIPIYGVDTTKVSSNSTADNYFIYMSDGIGNNYNNAYGGYYSFGNLTKQFANTLVSNNFNIYSITPAVNLNYLLPESSIQNMTIQQLLNSTATQGKNYDSTSTGGLTQLDTLLSDLKTKLSVQNSRPLNNVPSSVDESTDLYDSPKSGYIAINETLNLVKTYNDLEKDTGGKNIEFAERWELAQDPNYFENSLGYTSNTISLSQYLVGQHNWSAFNTVPTNSINFNTVGKFLLSYSAEDNPNINTPASDGSLPDATLFNNYCQSNIDGSNNQIYIYVNRRPISYFSYIQNGSNFSMTNTSYDQDHISASNKGIAETLVKYKKTSDSSWTYGTPTVLDSTQQWEVAQKVKDVDGFTSNWFTVVLGSMQTNFPPVANFKLDTKLMIPGGTNNITETTPYNDYDPDGDPIIEKHWWILTLDQVGNVISTQDYGSTKPNLSTLPKGNYELKKMVRDDPSARSATLTSLWSQPYYVSFSVLTNSAPVANFNIDTTSMILGSINNISEVAPYNDSDPDGDPIIEKHWWILTLNKGSVVSTQDYGSTKPNLSTLPAGNYELEKMVRDDPSARAAALPSLWSQPYYQIFTVINNLTITGDVSPNPCHAGERVYIKCYTTGYGQTVTVSLWNGDSVTLTPEMPTTTDYNTWDGNYIVPLNTADGTYPLVATVQNGSQTATANLSLTVQGNMLNLIKPRIIDSN